MTSDIPLQILGGISAREFLRDYWQKKPLLIRQAIPGFQSPISPDELAGLSLEEDVESRLVIEHGETPWELRRGPFTEDTYQQLPERDWTLLVQAVDQLVPDVAVLIEHFRFLPNWRIDDVMISYAAPGGGVGPHFDNYDVFLLQAHGQRRWRVGQMCDSESPMLAHGDLRILADFQGTEEWVLEPGDMLYLPPMWGHDGVAEGECMTCSIGFRAPEATEITREVLGRCAEGMDVAAKPRLYKDPQQAATDQPGRIPPDLQQFALEAVQRFLSDPQQIQAALGESLTELKPRVWFEPGEPLPDGVGVVLDAKTRMVYDDKRIFANGESWLAAGADARLMRALADQRQLSALAVAKASPDARELLDQWAEDGWLHPRP